MKILSFFAVLFLLACEPGQVDKDPSSFVTIQTAQGQSYAFDVELALTTREIQKGLMHRTDLAEEAGMLFVFGGEAERRFWMKNTLIPLDMIFVRANGTIHHIHPEAKPHDLTGVPSNGPVKAVLEINGGLADKLGIRAGDRLIHPFFNNVGVQ